MLLSRSLKIGGGAAGAGL